jgi:[ribosomal protein S5]-alanine N-acetyltransferase
MTIDAMFTQFPCLTTDRLLLRQIQLTDAEALFAIFSDANVMEFYGHMPHRSEDDSQELIRQQYAGMQDEKVSAGASRARARIE